MREDLKLANPGYLGLSAFVIAQLLLNIPNAHLVPVAATELFLSTILATGGAIQLLCCVFEYLRGNAFGTTTFGIYGSFFLALGMFFIFDKVGIVDFGKALGPALGVFVLVWGLFTVGITVIAAREDRLLGLTFVFITVSFIGGALHFLIGLDSAYGGWGGIISALLGIYLVFRGLWAETGPAAAADAVEHPDHSALIPRQAHAPTPSTVE